MPLAPLKFDVYRPLPTGDVQRNIDHACGLGLPEALSTRRLDIVANGPSASSAPFLDFQDTLFLNGALGLARQWDLIPTMWMACDPQPLVADFLTWAPEETIYYICSQCHPSVFSRLEDRDVEVFHVQDETLIPGLRRIQPHGSSVTLTAMMMAPSLGYNDIHIWGWDCCVMDGEHHAHGSALPMGMEVRGLEHHDRLDGNVIRVFQTTNTWAYEAYQAVPIINAINAAGVWLGLSITVHGDGLVRHTLDFHASLESIADAPTPSP